MTKMNGQKKKTIEKALNKITYSSNECGWQLKWISRYANRFLVTPRHFVPLAVRPDNENANKDQNETRARYRRHEHGKEGKNARGGHKKKRTEEKIKRTGTGPGI